MNISIAPTASTAKPGAAPAGALAISPETAVLQDFSALLGMPQVHSSALVEEGVAGDEAVISPQDDNAAADLTGKILPDDFAGVAGVAGVAGFVSPAMPVAAAAGEPAQTDPLLDGAASHPPRPQVKEEGKAAPQMPAPFPAFAKTAEGQTQLILPLDARSLQGAAKPAEALPAQSLAHPGAAAIKLAAENASAENEAPSEAAPLARTAAAPAEDAPALARSASHVSAGSAIAAADAPRMSAPAATAPSPAPAGPAAHDFEAVVDRLADAREQARPGLASMQIRHSEFGNVSVQFELAGRALKVALSSNDAAFAPTMQAALAERPIAAISETARADNQPARHEAGGHQGASSQGSSGADQQARPNAPRSAQAPQRQPAANDDAGSSTHARNPRSGDLFA